MKREYPYTIHLFIILLSIVALSCNKGHELDCFKSTGKDVREFRPTGKFSHIVVRDNVNLVIRQDTANTIEVVAGENLLDGIITQIDNNALFISNQNNCNFVRSFSRKITVYVSFDRLRAIQLRGSGDLTSEGPIKIYKLDIDMHDASGSVDMELEVVNLFTRIHTGTGDFKLKGSAEESFIFANGEGTFNLEELAAKRVVVASEGIGDVSVQALETLSASIKSVGDIYYIGNPDLEFYERTGKGQLVNAN